MSKTINDLSKSLKDLELGLTEEQVQRLINAGLVNINTRIDEAYTSLSNAWSTINEINTRELNSQQYKLTTDEGQGFGLSNQNADSCTGAGTIYIGENITNSPACAVGTWWTIENYLTADVRWGHQIATAWHSNEIYIRRKINGTFDGWRRIVENSTTDSLQNQISEIRPTVQNAQLSKITSDWGHCINISGQDLNTATPTNGNYMGDRLINAPSSNWYYIEVFVHNSNYQMQRLTDLHNSAIVWTRHKIGGAWSEWRSL